METGLFWEEILRLKKAYAKVEKVQVKVKFYGKTYKKKELYICKARNESK